MPEVADGTPVRYVDVAAPWLAELGGDSHGARLEAAVVARVRLRYDDDKAGLVHDEEYETVLFPLAEPVDVTRSIGVDYDDRDLRPAPTGQAVYRLTDAPIGSKQFWTRVQRDLVDHLVRTRPLELTTNPQLKLFARPGEAPDAFALRCRSTADDLADAEVAALREKYENKVAKLQDQIAAAEDRVDVLAEEKKGRRSQELLSTAGSLLGGLFGGRGGSRGLAKKVLGGLGGAAGRRSRSNTAGERLDAAENKVEALQADLAELEIDLAQEISDIEDAWENKAAAVSSMAVSLERTDVSVAQVVLAWVPVA